MVTESSLGIARGWKVRKWKMTGNKDGVFLWVDQTILELDIVVMIVQPGERW